MTSAGVRHPMFARLYAWGAPRAERHGMAELRRELVEGLSGRVLEVGAGIGLSFRHYPAAVAELVAIEPELHLRERAEQAAAHAPIPVRVLDGVAERLPVVDASFDAAVVALVLCSVRDQAQALRELWRALRPGGELRFHEHVRAEAGTGLACVQAALDPVWPHLAGGCHLRRDTLAAIEQAGFALERVRRFRFSASVVDRPTSFLVLGAARKP